jgi:hypothetical protein
VRLHLEAIVIVLAPPTDGGHNSRGVKKYEYNNVFQYFFTPLSLRASSGGDAGTITLASKMMTAFHQQINLLLFYAPWFLPCFDMDILILASK